VPTMADYVRGCEAAGWVPVKTVERTFPRGAHLQFLSAAVQAGSVSYTGMLLRTVDGGLVTDSSVVLDRFDGEQVGLPPLARSAAHPRVLPSSDGRLYLLWGESGDSKAELAPDSWEAVTTSIWYSMYTRGRGWSRPVELARDSLGFWWYNGAGSFVQTPGGEIHIAVGDRRLVPGHIVHVVIPPRGEPRVKRIPLEGISSPYPAMLVSGDSVLIASGGTGEADRQRLRMYLFLSEDGGRSWGGPHVRAPWEVPNATTANLARTVDGQLHLVLGQAAPSSVWTERFHHFSSPDGGRTWQFREKMEVPTAVQEPQLMGDHCGRLHFVFRDANASWTRILYTRWSGEGWGEPIRLFPDREPRSAVLLREASAMHLVLLYTGAEDSNVLTWARLTE